MSLIFRKSAKFGKMKTNIIKRILAAFAVCLILFSCGKVDPDNGGGGSSTVVEPSPFDNADTYGTITDAVTGEGIANVPVTDGFTFTKTNAKGEYGLNRNQNARKVYYTTPEGYEINLDPSTKMPLFYSDGILPSKDKVRKDFKLKKLAAPQSHVTIIAVGDPQCANSTMVSRFSNETIPDMKATISSLPDANVYAVTLGDINYDSNATWGEMESAMGELSVNGRQVPFFQCIGNHDHDSTVPEAEGEFAATLRYVSTYGPTDYSFDRSGVHVVVMDDIRVKSLTDSKNSNGKKWEYTPKFDDDQENWLAADLAMVQNPEKKTVILCLHAPMTDISTSRASKFLEMMTQFKEAHIFSGHTHCNENFVHTNFICRGGRPIYEHTHATACGMWWRSHSDVSGCPAGYSVYSFTDGSLDNWYLKGTGRTADFQIRAYNGSEIYKASKGANKTYNWYTSTQALTSSYNIFGYPAAKDCLIADVFNSDDQYWTVELFVGGVKAGDFKIVPSERLGNICHASWVYNGNASTTTNVGRTLMSRMWYFKTDVLPSELKNWEIVATQTIPGSGKKNVYKCSALTGGEKIDY